MSAVAAAVGLSRAEFSTRFRRCSCRRSSCSASSAIRQAREASYRISDLELASRLSFFLWSSIPDDQLLDLAERGRLKDPGVLERQVRRMLADPRADALISNFAGQWLHLRNVETVQPDPVIFPFDEALRQSFVKETELFSRASSARIEACSTC